MGVIEASEGRILVGVGDGGGLVEGGGEAGLGGGGGVRKRGVAGSGLG